MNIFDIAAILLTLAAVFGYLNFRFLRLPQTIGILAIALVSSLVVLGVDLLNPDWHPPRTHNGVGDSMKTRLGMTASFLDGMS